MTVEEGGIQVGYFFHNMSILILSKVMQYQKFYLLHYKDQGSNSLDVHKD